MHPESGRHRPADRRRVRAPKHDPQPDPSHCESQILDCARSGKSQPRLDAPAEQTARGCRVQSNQNSRRNGSPRRIPRSGPRLPAAASGPRPPCPRGNQANSAAARTTERRKLRPQSARESRSATVGRVPSPDRPSVLASLGSSRRIL